MITITNINSILSSPIGVRPAVNPLTRGKSEMLTHEDMLTQVKAYALTGEYSAHADNRISAPRGDISLTRDIYRSREQKHLGSRRQQHIALTRETAYTAHAGNIKRSREKNKLSTRKIVDLISVELWRRQWKRKNLSSLVILARNR